jgi:hypothetical protein
MRERDLRMSGRLGRRGVDGIVCIGGCGLPREGRRGA